MRSDRVPAAAWVGLVLPALGWGTYVFVAWFLVPLACDAGADWLLNLFAAGSLAVAAVGVVFSLRALRRARGSGLPDTAGVRVGRLIPAVAVLLSVLFVLGIVLLWSFTIFISPCERG